MSLDLATLTPVPDGRDTPIGLVQEDLDHIISNDLINSPRSLQMEIGPSEINHKCARSLYYKQLATPTINQQGLAWRPAVGTGVHGLLEGVFHRTNEMLGTTRFLIEQRVTIGEVCGRPISGSCDLADRVNRITVDWKIVGPTTLRRVKADKKPSDEYRAQAHAYARGFNMAGIPIDRVSIYYLPSNGEFADGYLWSEPYDEQIVLDALKRLEAITILADTMGAAGLGLVPTADAYCTRCPYHRAGSTDLAQGCPGDPAALNRATDSITSLIA